MPSRRMCDQWFSTVTGHSPDQPRSKTSKVLQRPNAQLARTESSKKAKRRRRATKQLCWDKRYDRDTNSQRVWFAERTSSLAYLVAGPNGTCAPKSSTQQARQRIGGPKRDGDTKHATTPWGEAEKFVAQRGSLRLCRYTNCASFTCSRCASQKTTKLVASRVDDPEKAICNGCYGFLLSAAHEATEAA